MISRRPDFDGQVEVDRAVEAARAHQGRVEVGGPVGGADDEDVGRRVGGLVEVAPGGKPVVHEVDQRAAKRIAAGGWSKDWSWISSSLTTPATPS